MALQPDGKKRETKLEQMKKKLAPLKLPPIPPPPSPIEILDQLNLPANVVEVLEANDVEKIWYLPATKHYKLDLKPLDSQWNSFVIVKSNMRITT